MNTTHYALEMNEYGDAHLERYDSKKAAFVALEQSQLVTMRAIVPESVVLAGSLTHREMLRLYKITLQDILEYHPAVEDAYWRFIEKLDDDGEVLGSDIVDAWHEGAFNADSLVREIDETITYMLANG